MPLTDYKLLLLNVNRNGWHSGNMVYDMEVIKRACNTEVYGPGWPNYQNNDIGKIIKQVYGSETPDIIYSYFTPNETVGAVYMNHYKISEQLRVFPTNFDVLSNDKYKHIKRAFAVSDFWARSPEKWKNDMAGTNFQYCFSCFVPPLSNRRDFFTFLNPSFMSNPIYIPLARCVDRDCFMDYSLPKEHDIITLGSMCSFYNFRRYMHGTLSNLPAKNGVIYVNYPHCGTNFSHSSFVREEYAKAINKSKILASCGGRYHLPFNKIFESWGCNTLYLGERPNGEEFLHMEDGYNYVATTRSDFLEKVKYYLANPKKTEGISRNGYDTFMKFHHIDARASDFSEILSSIFPKAH